MTQVVKLKRSATPSKVPTTSDLDLGEVAINTYDGKVFIKKDDGTPAVVEVGVRETTASIGSLINGATAKSTPVNNDQIGLMDSESSNVLKKLSWSDLQTPIQTKLSGKKNYHGIQSIGAYSFDNSTHILTVAGVTYWHHGTQYTTVSNVTADIDDYFTIAANTLYYFYFEDASGVLKVGTTFWDLTQKVPVATVFWSGTNGLIYRENHSYDRNLEWHITSHSTVGALYKSGLGCTYPSQSNPTVLQIEAGIIHDEDIQLSIPQQTNCRIWYKVNSTTYTYADSDYPYAWSGSAFQYLNTNTYTLTDVPADNYVNYWVYASDDISGRSIYIIPSHVTSAWSNLSEARSGLPPTLTDFNLSPEMKLIYKFLYKGDGTLKDVIDYRKSVGAVTNVILALDGLVDVNASSPSVGNVLSFNGLEWVNSPAVVGGLNVGNDFYLDDTSIIATGTNNANRVATLTKTPVTTAEVVESIVTNTSTVLGTVSLFDTSLGVTSLDSGTWTVSIFAGMNNTGGTNTLTGVVYRVRGASGTITITGSGTSRTATASEGTPFATSNIDASATITNCSYLMTPNGLYAITGRTSDTVVTITTPTTYVNESSVAFSVYKKLLSVSGLITNTAGTSPNYTTLAKYELSSTQGTFTVDSADKLGLGIFGTSTNNGRTFYYSHNGTNRQSNLTSPLNVTHNFLSGLQGGTASERYHLTSAQSTLVTSLISGTPNLPNGTTTTTQSQSDNSTKLATTAYVDTGLRTMSTAEKIFLYSQFS